MLIWCLNQAFSNLLISNSLIFLKQSRIDFEFWGRRWRFCFLWWVGLLLILLNLFHVLILIPEKRLMLNVLLISWLLGWSLELNWVFMFLSLITEPPFRAQILLILIWLSFALIIIACLLMWRLSSLWLLVLDAKFKGMTFGSSSSKSFGASSYCPSFLCWSLPPSPASLYFLSFAYFFLFALASSSLIRICYLLFSASHFSYSLLSASCFSLNFLLSLAAFLAALAASSASRSTSSSSSLPNLSILSSHCPWSLRI